MTNGPIPLFVPGRAVGGSSVVGSIASVTSETAPPACCCVLSDEIVRVRT